MSATPTPEALNHFLCYESHQRPLGVAGVDLAELAPNPSPTSKVTVRRAKRLCAPADKNGDDPTAPLDLAHLTAYTIHQTTPRFVRRKDVQVKPDNPIFKPLTVDLVRPDRLLVPASKIAMPQDGAIPDPLAAPIDHYKCYRVKGARERLSGVNLVTQFGPISVSVKRPLHLCAPVEKNGEGIVDPVRHLMCYQVRAVPQAPLEVSTNNQFEQDTFPIFGIRELCVPAFVPPGSCNDGVVNDVGEECDPPGANLGCASGTCNQDCSCCQPLEECPQGACGDVPDGCGGTIACGQCTAPEVCGGGGVANQCAVLPVCDPAGSYLQCRCGDGVFTCVIGCSSGSYTCAEARQECAAICGGGGPGECATKLCEQCDTQLPCQ